MLVVLVVFLFSALSLVFNPLFFEELGRSDELTKSIIQYFLSGDFSVPVLSLSPAENSHLRDVKLVVFNAELLLVLSLLGLFLLWPLSSKVLLWSGIVVIMIPVFLFFVPFERLFVDFHLVVFPQGNWQFDPQDTTLVNVYSLDFFRQFFVAIVMRAMIVGGGLVLIAKILRD